LVTGSNPVAAIIGYSQQLSSPLLKPGCEVQNASSKKDHRH
jgi:hypothetical protein